MTTTQKAIWDDTANKLITECTSGTNFTIDWDDTNNWLEFTCSSTDYALDWDDTNNFLSVTAVDCGCQEFLPGSVCTCFGTDLTPKFYEVTFSDIVDCGIHGVDCATSNGTYILEHNVFGCEWVLNSIDGSGNGFITILNTGISGSSISHVLFSGFSGHTCFLYSDSVNCNNTVTGAANDRDDCAEIIAHSPDGIDGTVSWAPL